MHDDPDGKVDRDGTILGHFTKFYHTVSKIYFILNHRKRMTFVSILKRFFTKMYIQNVKSDLINNIYGLCYIRISGTEPSSVILIQTKNFSKSH